MTITPEQVAALKADATPGPWKVVADETAAQVKGFPRIEAEDYEIVGIEGMYGDYETDWANARFIAAAPDMADLIARMDQALKAADALAKEAIAAHDELALWFESANSLEEHGFDMGDTERSMNALDRALAAFRTAQEKLSERPNGGV